MDTTNKAAWAIIGGGNMARAIIEGGKAADLLDPARVVVAEPDAPKRTRLEALGCIAVATAAEALLRLRGLERDGPRGQILLAVKPQSLEAVGAEIGPALSADARVVVTILAGTPGRKVRAALGGRVAVVRAMPNLPAAVRLGATAVCLSDGSRPGDEASAEALFRGIGPLVIRIEEGLMDAFTAVAGSGPAYVCYLAEAMIRAGIELGFDPGTAAEIARVTIAGAGAMIAAPGGDPATLRSAVTSKGGTTAAALDVLESQGVMDSIVRAITAARDRGRELARL